MLMGSSSCRSQDATGASDPRASIASKSGPRAMRRTVGGTAARRGSSSGETNTMVAPLWPMM
jgi:hypothetical protein